MEGAQSQSWARPSSSHAWMQDPALYLSAVGKAQPRVKAAATLGLATRALAEELKASASILLGLIDEFGGTISIQETLRSALHWCVHVHDEEVLPGVLRFTAHGGAAPKEWAQALGRSQRGRTWQPRFPRATEEEIEALSSESQKALLRSLQKAVELGVGAASQIHTRLGAQMCACKRLREKSSAAPREAKRHSSANVTAWQRAPFHRNVECAEGKSSQTSDVPFKPGPNLVDHDDEIARLVQPLSPPWEVPAKAEVQAKRALAPAACIREDRHADQSKPARPQTARAAISDAKRASRKGCVPAMTPRRPSAPPGRLRQKRMIFPRVQQDDY